MAIDCGKKNAIINLTDKSISSFLFEMDIDFNIGLFPNHDKVR